ncbi:MAG: biotin--[acetyl-CoA-carboxylase] ligase [Candidatus Rokubacteria bacterium]|nr:biotin--[acetyl-CoA-carboxylase] ligase [Candidatus Rokubacteria bacterium]
MIIKLDVVDSTQRAAWALVDDGAADGTVVVAEAQTEGKGRRGRVWEAPAGTSLLMSMVMRTRLTAAERPLLSFAVAVAIGRAITRLIGLPCGLKWPNDVRVDGRKVAGVLLEARGDVVVAGIGINVNQARFPEPLAARATSLRLVAGRVIERDLLRDIVREEIATWRRQLEDEGFEPIRQAWRGAADMLGRQVTVDGFTGIADDVGADGGLVIRRGTEARVVRAGELVETAEER